MTKRMPAEIADDGGTREGSLVIGEVCDPETGDPVEGKCFVALESEDHDNPVAVIDEGDLKDLVS